jgi:hypothetical protein
MKFGLEGLSSKLSGDFNFGSYLSTIVPALNGAMPMGVCAQ